MLYLPIIISLFALVFAGFLARQIKLAPSGQGKMIAVFKYIREGALAYLKRQYKTIGIVAVFLFFLLWILLGFKAASGFLLGVAFSAISGFAGMITSTQANVKVAEAAKKGLTPALNLAFKGGAVTGFLVVGFGLLAVSGFYILTHDLKSLVALGFGASLISVFARLGDCAGTAADLFETYVIGLVAAMILGALIFPGNLGIILLPLFLGGVAILSSIIASFFVKLGKSQSLIGSALLSAFGFLWVIKNFAPSLNFSFWQLYLPALMGLMVAGGMFLRVKIAGTGLSVALICLGILVSFLTGGIMGLAISVVSMLSLVGMIVALDSSSFILDTASSITKTAGLDVITIGNTTKAVTKAYAITSAGLAALVLFAAYAQEIQGLGAKTLFYLGDYKVLIGLFFGGLLPFLFASFLKEIMKPALIPIIFPILVGFVLGPEALGGLLMGSIVTGVFVAISIGPAINPMIKVPNIVALLIVSFLV